LVTVPEKNKVRLVSLIERFRQKEKRQEIKPDQEALAWLKEYLSVGGTHKPVSGNPTKIWREIHTAQSRVTGAQRVMKAVVDTQNIDTYHVLDTETLKFNNKVFLTEYTARPYRLMGPGNSRRWISEPGYRA
jgi:hypothetical protein